jgi:lysophospholipase L1-like esterase
MALSTSYVDAAGAPVNWSTAVVGGAATIDIFQVVADDQHSNTLLWARAGQAVPAARVAAAQADTFPAGGRARTGTLTSSADVVNAGAGTAYRVLPASATTGTVRGVQNNGEGVVYVDAPGAETIDGGTAPISVHAGELAQFQANGSGAWVRLVAANTLLNNTYAALGLAGRQAYETQDAIALRRFRYALGDRNANPCDVLHVGDSITQGYRASSLANRWASVFRDTIRSRFATTGVGSGGFGYVPARTLSNYTAPFSDNLVSALTGGTNTFGLDGVDLQMVASGTITLTFTGTGCDILTTKFSGGGTYTYTVDGGAASSAISVANATNLYGAVTAQIRGLAAGSHTVVVSRASGTVFLEGFMTYNADETKGVRSWVAAVAGSYSGDWSTRATTYWPNYITQIQPDLVTIELGANDYINTSPVSVTTFKANVKSIIATVKANSTAVPSFVLMPVWAITGNGTPVDTWANYVAATYAIANEDTDGAVCVLDLQKRINPGAASTVGGMLPDSSHPDDAANRYIGELLARFVEPR